MHQLGQWQGDGGLRRRGHHALDFTDAETAEGEPQVVPPAVELGERTRQWAAAADLHIAVGAHQQQGDALETAR
jgi:hypothetical protein